MTVYLYLKTHNVTGMKYLGMTTRDPYTYKGSGSYWKNHIKTHGNNISTEILKECDSYDELSYWGRYYSDLWNIVESEEYANLIPELGENSCGMEGKLHSDETKSKISNALIGHEVSGETRNKLSLALTGNIVSWNKGKRGEYHIFSDEEKLKRSIKYSGNTNPFFGKTHTEEFKLSQTLNQKKVVKCPHCIKEGSIRIMKRWHFDRCKNKI